MYVLVDERKIETTTQKCEVKEEYIRSEKGTSFNSLQLSEFSQLLQDNADIFNKGEGPTNLYGGF